MRHYGEQMQRGQPGQTTCHSHLMIADTVMSLGRFSGWIVLCVVGVHAQWYLFPFLWILKPCVRLNLQTVVMYPACGLLYTLMTHLIHLLLLLFYMSQTFFSVCVLYLFVIILRSLKATLVSVCIRREKCPMHVVCNFNKGYAPQNTLCIVFKDMKWFIITVQN